MALKTIAVTSTTQRAALLAAALVCIVAVFFVVKWSIANTASTRNLFPEVADLAITLAPNDPQTHFARGAIYEQSLFVEDIKNAVREYEIAASLSPNDFRYWYSLGLARERAGDGAGAELALRKSLELAPNYSAQLWATGNVLLRQGKTDQAFEFIRSAAESDISLAAPAVVATSQVFPDNPEMVRSMLGNSSNADAAAAVYFARSGNFGVAREFWSSISAENKLTAFRETGETLFAHLIEAKRFRFAAEVANDIGKSGEERFETSRISNASFESDIASGKATLFDWNLGDGLQPHIGFDESTKYRGDRSLGLVYDSPNGLDFRTLQQTVPVESDANYTFEVFVRADFKSESSLKWEIVDANSGAILGATSSIPNASDWAKISTDFKVGPELEAIIIRIARVPCDGAVCPMKGKIWFDDLLLQRAN